MLYWKDGQLNLCPHKVNYTQHGEQQEAYTDNKAWWENFAQQWDHTTIESFENVNYTAEQLQRYEEIKSMPEGHAAVCGKYVEDGSFPEGSHPLENLQLKKENDHLRSVIDAMLEPGGVV